MGNGSVDLEQYFRAIKPANYELKVDLGAGSHARLASARRVYAGLVNVRAKLHRSAMTFRKG